MKEDSLSVELGGYWMCFSSRLKDISPLAICNSKLDRECQKMWFASKKRDSMLADEDFEL